MTEEDEPLFIDNIMSSTLPPWFRMPTVTPYTDSGDPTRHLKSFRAWMELQSTFKPIICCTFYLTLAGAMRSWYRQLKPKLINSFSDLSKAFLMQFIFGKERRKSSTHLLTIKQKEGEALKDYIIRFNEEAVQVNDYSDKIALTVMIVGLREGSSQKATQDVKNSTKDKKRKEEAPSQAPSNKRRKDEKPVRGQRPSIRPKSRFNSYTPILEVRDKRLMKWPNQIKTDVDKQDKQKYCHFNCDHNHSTSDYFDLKEEIKALIHSGHLREYVKEERSGRKDENPIRTIKNNPTGEIRIIFGRLAGGGDSNQVQKAHA
ncbi:uncharacterized protein LOC131224235 [Magnolia sinica]|uniref:uncharacterized protein LOC131224235 n=1 Tax=Magnolia sinica TaxID=86752 RepID=UPI002657E09B|nr:uncharacterized protein LOC131224235 [Magnolia sinica]